MGTYDTINVPCPKCGTKSGFQTKSGRCTLAEYELNEAPADVMEDVMRHGPATCLSCGTIFGVQFQIVSTVTAQSIVWPPEDINQCPDCKGSGNIQCITCGGLGATSEKLPCGCHCSGGCGDPYAACIRPCNEHIPL